MKQIFSKEDILSAGFSIVRDEGYEAVTMRRVADAAGSSVQPLYSMFGDREAYMGALYQYAVQWVRDYNSKHSDAGCNVFSSVGIAHIRIAQDLPGVFAFVYMSPYVKAKDMEGFRDLAEQPGVVSEMESMWGISQEQAKALYSELAIYTHGLATLIMAGARFTDDELKAGMNNVFFALAESMGIRRKGAGDEG